MKIFRFFSLFSTFSLWLFVAGCSLLLAAQNAHAKRDAQSKPYYTHIGAGLRSPYNPAELKFLAEFNRFPVYASARVRTTRHYKAQTAHTSSSKSVQISVFTATIMLRRNETLDNFYRELADVREHPNRWLRQVLGKSSPSARPRTGLSPKIKPNEYRLHTGIKHATSRRSRYV